jgi:hypothetical protein
MPHGHSTAYPYPTLPHAIDAMPQIVAQLTGKLNDIPCAINCAWTVIGYAASLGFPHPTEMHAGSVSCDDTDQCVKTLEDAQKKLEASNAGAVRRAAKKGHGDPLEADDASAIPWAVIVPLVFDLFLKWWQKRND